MFTHATQQIETVTDSTEIEIACIKDEKEKVDSKLKEIEEKIDRLEAENDKIKANSPKKSEKDIYCTKCDRCFQSNSHLEKHLKDEHRVKTIQCGKCDMSFHTKWRLLKHQRSHDDNMKQRRCYYFNAGKHCPFELLGCKFLHEISEPCKYGSKCLRHMCQFRH